MNITNGSGLVFSFHDCGSLSQIEAGAIRVGLKPEPPGSRTGANLFLRVRGDRQAYTALLGAHSPSRWRATGRGFEARGSWADLDYSCQLQLPAQQLSWQWLVQIESRRDRPVELDLIYVQDVGLRASSAELVNEHYVSQYLERRVFEHPQHGCVVCCRQNMRESTGNPWLMIACAQRAVAASTDGLQFYGNMFRSTGEPAALAADRLGGELAGEAAVVALQTASFALERSGRHASAFVATYLPDHPEASSEQDLQRLPELTRSFSGLAKPSAAGGFADPRRDRFRSAPLMPAEDLDRAELEQLFGPDLRHVEQAHGELLSFFTPGPRHVVLRAKEQRVDRPHGHILQANLHADSGYVPSESIMSTTAFACGVFNAHLTQGNTNFNTLLSVCTQPATPALEGQRIFLQLPDGEGEYALGVASAFEMGLNHCRWIYKRGPMLLQVSTWTAPHAPRINLAVELLRGGPIGLSVTHQLDASNGWRLSPGAPHEFIAQPRSESALARQFPNARFRMIVNSPDSGYRAHQAERHERDMPEGALFVIEVPEARAFCMSVVGEIEGPVRADHIDDAQAARLADGARAQSAWAALSRELRLDGSRAIAAIDTVLPWYGQNALVHYLTPYGLEQFSGAAWGTRDVCQGPLELLLSQERYAEAKQVLHRLFSHQNPDGSWPQWWMFDRYRSVRADAAHGDVIYWCLLGLCSYIKASGDFAILDEPLAYFQEPEPDRPVTAPLSEHVDRIIALVVKSFVPGTALVQFGGGDWNDSLQPVSADLARRLISSWTVQMCYQALCEYREVCERAGRAATAQALDEITARILADFQRHLVRAGVVAGYGLVGADGHIAALLHPSDTQTGVHYSLLPMDRGVLSGMFDRAQAERHLELIEEHLQGPDGARLMDRPLRYHGGPQTLFQRAESSSYFGREIGLMYVHEHLRYAQAQALMGKPDALLRALRLAIPVDYRELVPQADLRQANCYYSSSDVLFKSRYDADTRYGEVLAGDMPLRGGWRVYSSGPGIFVGLVQSRLLGLRIEFGDLIIDPVLARSLDGLRASLRFRGLPVRFVYRVAGAGFGPQSIRINGNPITFEREPNRYREGGAVMSLTDFTALLDAPENRVEIVV